MDIQMPVMNGYEATRTIRNLPGEYAETIPIIAMSANAYEEDIREAFDSGMNGHIAKPFDPQNLANELNNQINRKLDVDSR
jgi:CheY-like chemotaxis protein